MASKQRKPGNYDALCLEVFRRTSAKAAVLIIVRGQLGPGVSIKEEFSVAGGEYHVKRLPKLLRQIATEIENENLRRGEAEV